MPALPNLLVNIDLTMIIRPEMRRFQVLDILVEFKYLPLSKVAMDGTSVSEQSADALKALTSVTEKLAEARKQVRNYRTKLVKKYGDALRLRSYAVVAIGFERVLWEEVTE